jgi:hypothetical protein
MRLYETSETQLIGNVNVIAYCNTENNECLSRLNKKRAVAILEKFVQSSFPQTRKEVKETTNEYEWQDTSRGKVI